MPTLQSMRIPTPKSWEEFEDITLTCLKIKWNNPNLTKNGRQGQEQNGVDIYGDDDLGRYVGVQCKNTTKELTLEIINSEISKAEKFIPEISALFIATTSLSDSTIQKSVRLISKDRITQKNFSVGLFFWNDLIDDLVKVESEFKKHYPQFNISMFKPSNGTSRLLSILSIAYSGLYIDRYINLVFGEFGLMAGTDPIEIEKLCEDVKSAVLLIDPDKLGIELSEKFDTIVKLCLETVRNDEENQIRWRKVDIQSNSIISKLSGLEYHFEGIELGVFTLGKILGHYSMYHSENTKVILKDETEIINCFKLLTIEPDDIKYITESIKEFSENKSVSIINIPHNLFGLARKKIRNFILK